MIRGQDRILTEEVVVSAEDVWSWVGDMMGAMLTQTRAAITLSSVITFHPSYLWQHQPPATSYKQPADLTHNTSHITHLTPHSRRSTINTAGDVAL